MAGKRIMNISLDTLVEMVEKNLILSEQENIQTIYKTSTKLRINNARSGDITQIINEVRGIEGVTTVNHRADYARKTDTFNFVFFEIKFELMGSDANPISYMKNILVPSIRKFKGIDIQDIQARPEKVS
jgi:hypothetical protein